MIFWNSRLICFKSFKQNIQVESPCKTQPHCPPETSDSSYARTDVDPARWNQEYLHTKGFFQTIIQSNCELKAQCTTGHTNEHTGVTEIEQTAARNPVTDQVFRVAMIFQTSINHKLISVLSNRKVFCNATPHFNLHKTCLLNGTSWSILSLHRERRQFFCSYEKLKRKISEMHIFQNTFLLWILKHISKDCTENDCNSRKEKKEHYSRIIPTILPVLVKYHFAWEDHKTLAWLFKFFI